MSTLAEEEVQRLFSQEHTRLQSHPEDRDDLDRSSEDEKDTTEPAFAADLDQDTDDELDVTSRMNNLNTSRSTYILPYTTQYANTGPKGVIADAQSFNRAKRDAQKIPLTSVTKMTFPDDKQNMLTKERDSRSGSEEEEDDEAFMEEWRARRLAELSANAHSHRMLSADHSQSRRISPSRRTYGHAVRVDAPGYLDAIEKVSSETTVLVMIYDPESSQSNDIEDEVDILAYKHGHVRFVKLDHQIAEMEHIQIPALLAYKGGEVYATISGAKREGLEAVLSQQGVFS